MEDGKCREDEQIGDYWRVVFEKGKWICREERKIKGNLIFNVISGSLWMGFQGLICSIEDIFCVRFWVEMNSMQEMIERHCWLQMRDIVL